MKKKKEKKTNQKDELIASPYISSFKPAHSRVLNDVKNVMDTVQEKIFEGMSGLIEKSIDINQKYCDSQTDILQKQVDDLRTILHILTTSLPQKPEETDGGLPNEKTKKT